MAEAAVNTAKEHLHSNIEEDEDEPKKSWQTKKRKKKYEWPKKEEKELDKVQEEEHSQSGSEYSRDEVNGTSPAVIVQVSELLNDVYEKRRFQDRLIRLIACGLSCVPAKDEKLFF